MTRGSGFTRRRFLYGTGAAVLVLSLSRLGCEPAGTPDESSAEPTTSAPVYRNWEDIYRTRWTWDSIAKGTHYVNCWYQARCAWNVYVKDGVVFREEQVADYPQTNSDVPDFNPRGCQKGACYSERMYDAGRLQYPLERAGERGEGKWKRTSWDEALQEIADQTIDVLSSLGPAGDYQVEGARVALGHAYGGASNYFAMWIVSSEPTPTFS